MLLDKDTVRRVIRLAAESQGDAAREEAVQGAGALRSRLGMFLSGLSHQETVELVAMISVGRGDPGSDRFEFILGNIYMTKERAIDYLLGKQHLGEYLEKALKKLKMDETT